MSELTYTFIGDGSSDKALMNIIRWLINDIYPELPVSEHYADFRHFPNPPNKGDVFNQINFAEEYYPFDVLIYHRDAEENTKSIIQKRKEEVYSAIKANQELVSKVVCVVPIVMMESWLLFNETSIKKASGNKNYSGSMELPSISKVEAINDPKTYLHNLLKTVSCKKKRNLKQFNVHEAVHLVAENINDFSPLRQLTSFQCFEQDLKNCIDKIIENNGT
jgi:hypothetical protein